MKQNPVFVVGMNGSGTTMLADSLGQHPDLYMLPRETRVLPHLANGYSDEQLQEPAVRRALADELGRAKAFWRCNGDKPLILSNSAIDEALGFDGIVSAVYQHFSAKHGKSRWGDKTPMYLQHIELLGSRFPASRFVHIYRDGRDSAQSFHRRWHQDPRRTIYRWKKAIAMGRLQGKTLGSARYFEVRYEDLTAEPESWMRKICEFLALDFDTSVLHSSMHYMDNSVKAAAGGRMIENHGKWQTHFSGVQLADMERIAGSTLFELGYQVNVRGDEDLSDAELRTLKLKDWLNFSLLDVRKFGPRGLVPLFYRARDAWIQDRMNKY
jgi:Sulfotransferase family